MQRRDEFHWINVSPRLVARIDAFPFHRPMETAMAEVPVELKKAPPAQTNVPDVWQSFRSEMDRLFGSGFGFPSLRRMFDIEPAWRSSFSFSTPAIDMSEDEKAYKISAELPGIDAKDIDVSVSGDMLVLKGEKRQEKEEKDKNYHFSERAYGSFQRAFELPGSVDRNKIAADFSKGVLTITLPKTTEAQRPVKKIEVKSS
jgi:HSP20 family protein